jgi:hypothetical protein
MSEFTTLLIGIDNLPHVVDRGKATVGRRKVRAASISPPSRYRSTHSRVWSIRKSGPRLGGFCKKWCDAGVIRTRGITARTAQKENLCPTPGARSGPNEAGLVYGTDGRSSCRPLKKRASSRLAPTGGFPARDG